MFIENEFNNKIYIGIVEDKKDSKKKGRIKIRVQGVFDDLDIEDIPYASPYKNKSAKDFDIPDVGKLVNVIFVNGDIYSPEYIYSENYNINLQNKLKNLSDDEYDEFIALLFDHTTQIYKDDKKLMIDYFSNQIYIDDKNINLNLKDNSNKLNLGNSSASQSAVLGNNFFKWFDSFVDTLLQPTSLLGNMSAPILKPQVDLILNQYKALRKTFISQHVKIVNNGDCKNFDDRENVTISEDIININNEKILNSNEVKEEVKTEIKDKRVKDKEEADKNKPDENDIVTNDSDYKSDSGSNESNNSIFDNEDIDIDKLDLDSEDTNNIKKVNDVIKNNEEKEVSIDKGTNEKLSTEDYYSNLYTNFKGSEPIKPKLKKNYGWYEEYSDLTDNNATSEYLTNENYNDSNWGEYLTAHKNTRRKKTIYVNNKKITNGTDAVKKLLTVFTFRNKKQILEPNALKDFLKMNKEFKKEFGTDFIINETFRTYATQLRYKKIYGDDAATAGYSPHGWGTAIDISIKSKKYNKNSKITKDGFACEVHIWIRKNGKKYNWINPPWAHDGKGSDESWHFEYIGKTIYNS